MVSKKYQTLFTENNVLFKVNGKLHVGKTYPTLYETVL